MGYLKKQCAILIIVYTADQEACKLCLGLFPSSCPSCLVAGQVFPQLGEYLNMKAAHLKGINGEEESITNADGGQHVAN